MAMPAEAVRLEMGEVPAAGRKAADAATCGTLTWESLVVTVVDKAGHTREIVKQASGVAEPGQLMAIMVRAHGMQGWRNLIIVASAPRAARAAAKARGSQTACGASC